MSGPDYFDEQAAAETASSPAAQVLVERLADALQGVTVGDAVDLALTMAGGDPEAGMSLLRSAGGIDTDTPGGATMAKLDVALKANVAATAVMADVVHAQRQAAEAVCTVLLRALLAGLGLLAAG